VDDIQIDVMDNQGNTPLHNACAAGTWHFVICVWYLADVSDNCSMIAGNWETIKVLVSFNAKLGAKNKAEDLCIHVAAKHGMYEPKFSERDTYTIFDPIRSSGSHDEPGERAQDSNRCKRRKWIHILALCDRGRLVSRQ
jgi:hypothetical protein